MNKKEFLKDWFQGQAMRQVRLLIHTLCRTWYMLCVRMSLMDSTSSGESLLVPCILWALETSMEGSQALFLHPGKSATKVSIYIWEF